MKTTADAPSVKVRLPEEMKKRMEDLARMEGVAGSVLYRRAFREFISRNRRRK